MRFLGLLPMAHSKGVLPLRVTCELLTVAALRINWASVICDRVVLQQSDTHYSSKFPRSVWSSRKKSHFAFDSMSAHHEDDGKPCLHRSPPDSSGTHPPTHEVWR